MKIKISEEDNPQGGWTIFVDDTYANHLCTDEVLGVVAAALFGGFPRHHPYLKPMSSAS